MASTAPSTQHPVTLPDRRVLVLHEAGDPAGVPVVTHHGTPGDGTIFGPHAQDAAERGLRLISYDRAGYGGSSRDAGRDVASVAADLGAALDAIGVGEFLTWGASGGGPHALACAALLPDRVRAVASIAGVAPWDADGLDPMEGMGEDNVAEFGLAVQGESPLRPWLEQQRTELLAADAAELVEQMRSLLPPVDVRALDGDGGDYLHASMVTGLAAGVDGWLDDDLAFVRPWGFDLSSVAVPVLVRQGGQDLMVPAAHGPWLAAHLTGSTGWFEPDEGHVSLAFDMSRVHAWLLGHWPG